MGSRHYLIEDKPAFVADANKAHAVQLFNERYLVKKWQAPTAKQLDAFARDAGYKKQKGLLNGLTYYKKNNGLFTRAFIRDKFEAMDYS